MTRRQSKFQQPVPVSWYTDKTTCTECNKHRSSGSHKKCSRARQLRFATENKA